MDNNTIDDAALQGVRELLNNSFPGIVRDEEETTWLINMIMQE